MISVIVTVHNYAEYLHRCLDSIMRQTYSDLEIILMEDGSEDESRMICDDKDLALYSYQGVANECLLNCIKILRKYKKKPPTILLRKIFGIVLV